MPLPILQGLEENLLVADPTCNWLLRAAPVWVPSSQVQPPFPSAPGGAHRGKIQVGFPKCLLEGWSVVATPARTIVLWAVLPCKEQSDRAPERLTCPSLLPPPNRHLEVFIPMGTCPLARMSLLRDNFTDLHLW